MKHPNCPEVIASLQSVDEEGRETIHGDKIIGIQVRQFKECRDGTVDVDVRDFDKKTGNLIIQISLPEFMAALSSATLNAEREDI